MLDCMSGGRIVSGFARGIPREYNVYRVPLSESRARFEEAWEIIRRAWTEEVFSYTGKFWSYDDVAIWPRPVQQPHPPVWVPVSGSKETIEWAGKHDIPITPGLVPTRGLREDIIRYYARCLAQHGHRLTPGHLIIQASAYVADSKARAVKEAGPYTLYFNQTLFSHGNVSEASRQRDAGYLTDASFDYVRPENRAAVSGARERFRDMTMDDVARDAEQMAWGTPAEVRERIIGAAEHAGADTVAREHESRRDAARDVHGADPPLRHRGPARAASPHGDRRPPRLTMDRRRLGKTDIQASVLGFGGSEIGYERRERRARWPGCSAPRSTPAST